MLPRCFQGCTQRAQRTRCTGGTFVQFCVCVGHPQLLRAVPQKHGNRFLLLQGGKSSSRSAFGASPGPQPAVRGSTKRAVRLQLGGCQRGAPRPPPHAHRGNEGHQGRRASSTAGRGGPRAAELGSRAVQSGGQGAAGSADRPGGARIGPGPARSRPSARVGGADGASRPRPPRPPPRSQLGRRSLPAARPGPRRSAPPRSAPSRCPRPPSPISGRRSARAGAQYGGRGRTDGGR